MKVSLGKGKEVIINHVWRDGKYMSEGWKNGVQIFPEPTKWIDSFELEPVTTASNDDNRAYWEMFKLRRQGLTNWRNPVGSEAAVQNPKDLKVTAISSSFSASIRLDGTDYLLYETYDSKPYMAYSNGFQAPSGKNIPRDLMSDGSEISVHLIMPLLQLAYSMATDTNYVEYKTVPLLPGTVHSSFYNNVTYPFTKPSASSELIKISALNSGATVNSVKGGDFEYSDNGLSGLSGNYEKVLSNHAVGQAGIRMELKDSNVLRSILNIPAIDVNVMMRVTNVKYR